MIKLIVENLKTGVRVKYESISEFLKKEGVKHSELDLAYYTKEPIAGYRIIYKKEELSKGKIEVLTPILDTETNKKYENAFYVCKNLAFASPYNISRQAYDNLKNGKNTRFIFAEKPNYKLLINKYDVFDRKKIFYPIRNLCNNEIYLNAADAANKLMVSISSIFNNLDPNSNKGRNFNFSLKKFPINELCKREFLKKYKDGYYAKLKYNVEKQEGYTLDDFVFEKIDYNSYFIDNIKEKTIDERNIKQLNLLDRPLKDPSDEAMTLTTSNHPLEKTSIREVEIEQPKKNIMHLHDVSNLLGININDLLDYIGEEGLEAKFINKVVDAEIPGETFKAIYNNFMEE